jgi:hypothetical protein
MSPFRFADINLSKFNRTINTEKPGFHLRLLKYWNSSQKINALLTEMIHISANANYKNQRLRCFYELAGIGA